MSVTRKIAACCAAPSLAIFAAIGGLWPQQASAAPEEIVVFADEFEKPGEIGYELHFNFAAKARRTPDYPGEQPPDRVLRLMPEVVWGLSERWNLGLHLPTSHSGSAGTTTVDGFKARLQYLKARPSDAGNLFYGANYELSYFQRRLSPSRLVAEVRGIAGWRSREWLYALNPILSYPLDTLPGVEKRLDVEIYGKAMKSLTRDVAVGLEHYADFGALRNPNFGSAASQTSYAVLEFTTRSGVEIHAGLGHGWTQASDQRVYKLLLGLPF